MNNTCRICYIESKNLINKCFCKELICTSCLLKEQQMVLNKKKKLKCTICLYNYSIFDICEINKIILLKKMITLMKEYNILLIILFYEYNIIEYIQNIQYNINIYSKFNILYILNYILLLYSIIIYLFSLNLKEIWIKLLILLLFIFKIYFYIFIISMDDNLLLHIIYLITNIINIRIYYIKIWNNIN